MGKNITDGIIEDNSPNNFLQKKKKKKKRKKYLPLPTGKGDRKFWKVQRETNLKSNPSSTKKYCVYSAIQKLHQYFFSIFFQQIKKLTVWRRWNQPRDQKNISASVYVFVFFFFSSLSYRKKKKFFIFYCKITENHDVSAIRSSSKTAKRFITRKTTTTTTTTTITATVMMVMTMTTTYPHLIKYGKEKFRGHKKK